MFQLITSALFATSVSATQMTVNYSYPNGGQGTAISYGSKWGNNLPSHYNWACFDWQGQPSEYQNLETFQIVLDSNDSRDIVEITPQMAGYKYIVYHEDNPIWQGETPFGTHFQAKGLKNGASKMFTVIAVDKDGHRDPVNAYAIFVSKRLDSQIPVAQRGITVSLKSQKWSDYAMNGGDVDSQNNAFYNANNFSVAYGNKSAQPASDKSTWTTSLARPQWTYVNGKIGYWGSLVRFGGLNGSINIKLEDEASLDMPLTSEYFEMDLNQLINGADLNQTPAGGKQTIERWIATRLTEGTKGGQTTVLNLANSDSPYFNHKVQPAWGSSWNSLIEIQTMQFKQKVEVYGYGKVVGKFIQERMINNRWGWQMTSDMRWLINTSNPLPLGEVLEYIEFRILAGLLKMVSTYEPQNAQEFSINVWGVHVADPMKLNGSAAQLNGFNADNPAVVEKTRVKVYDAKLYTWFDGADGFEILAQNSVVMNSFVQSPDDSFKIAANGQQLIDNLVYQGNVGGALNMGVYGTAPVNIKGGTVSGLFVHRVAQSKDQYDERGGLIVIRQTRKGCNVQDVTVDRIFVPSLGGWATGKGLKGPNVIYRLWAFGIQPVGTFGGSGITNYTLVSDITLKNSDIYTNPLAISMIYGNSGTAFDGNTYTKLYGKNPAGKIWNLSFYDTKATTAKEVNNSMVRIWNSGTTYYGVWPNGLQNAKNLDGSACDPVGWMGELNKPDEVQALTVPTADWPKNKAIIPGTNKETVDYGNYFVVGVSSSNTFNVPYFCTKKLRVLGEADEAQTALIV